VYRQTTGETFSPHYSFGFVATWLRGCVARGNFRADPPHLFAGFAVFCRVTTHASAHVRPPKSSPPCLRASWRKPSASPPRSSSCLLFRTSQFRRLCVLAFHIRLARHVGAS